MVSLLCIYTLIGHMVFLISTYTHWSHSIFTLYITHIGHMVSLLCIYTLIGHMICLVPTYTHWSHSIFTLYIAHIGHMVSLLCIGYQSRLLQKKVQSLELYNNTNFLITMMDVISYQ